MILASQIMKGSPKMCTRQVQDCKMPKADICVPNQVWGLYNVSYRPSISPLLYGSSPNHTGLKSKGKNEDLYLAVQHSNSVSNLSFLSPLCEGLGLISLHKHRMAKAKECAQAGILWMLRGFFVSLAGHLLCWHLPLWRSDMFKNL